MSDIKIRKAKIADIDSIIKLNIDFRDYHHKIDKKYWAPGKNSRVFFKKFLLSQLKKRGALILVAEDKDNWLGILLPTSIKQDQRTPIKDWGRSATRI